MSSICCLRLSSSVFFSNIWVTSSPCTLLICIITEHHIRPWFCSNALRCSHTQCVVCSHTHCVVCTHTHCVVCSHTARRSSSQCELLCRVPQITSNNNQFIVRQELKVKIQRHSEHVILLVMEQEVPDGERESVLGRPHAEI